MSCRKRTPSPSGSRPRSSKAGTGECVWTWRPRRDGGKAETKKQACNNKLTIRARSVFARSRGVRRFGRGHAAGRHASSPNATSWSRTSSLSRWATRSPPAKAIPTGRSSSAQPRDGLRPDPAAGRGRVAQDRSTQTDLRRRPSPTTSSIRRCCRAAMEDEDKSPRFRGCRRPNSGPVRPGAGAVAQHRLPPLAIRLSDPRRPPACAGEPPPLGDVRDLHLLRRRGGRRAVPRDGSARGHSEPNGEGPRAARSADRSAVPRQRAAPSRRPTRCRCTRRQHRRCAAVAP